MVDHSMNRKFSGPSYELCYFLIKARNYFIFSQHLNLIIYPSSLFVVLLCDFINLKTSKLFTLLFSYLEREVLIQYSPFFSRHFMHFVYLNYFRGFLRDLGYCSKDFASEHRTLFRNSFYTGFLFSQHLNFTTYPLYLTFFYVTYKNSKFC